MLDQVNQSDRCRDRSDPEFEVLVPLEGCSVGVDKAGQRKISEKN
jgi:hypothetical protein